MSSVIRVSTTRMSGDRKEITERANRMSLEMNDLMDKMEALSACWEGPAWEAYKAEVNTRIGELYEAREFFRNVTEKLEEAEKTYLRCEESNRSELAGVRI